MLKKILAILCIIIIMLPFVPTNGNDDSISRQQMVEAIQETISGIIEEELKSYITSPLSYSYPGSDMLDIYQSLSEYLLFDEPLQKCYHLQVLIQPPNC